MYGYNERQKSLRLLSIKAFNDFLKRMSVLSKDFESSGIAKTSTFLGFCCKCVTKEIVKFPNCERDERRPLEADMQV